MGLELLYLGQGKFSHVSWRKSTAWENSRIEMRLTTITPAIKPAKAGVIATPLLPPPWPSSLLVTLKRCP